METGLKKLLVISWAMPPLVYPRSIQVARTLMALDRLGWKSTVLCVDRINVPDETPVDPELERLYGDSYKIVPVSVGIGLDQQSDASQNIWIRPAVRTATDLLGDERYSAMLTFAQPWVTHLVGLKLQTRFRLPWIAHFSDPWVDNLYYAAVDPKILKDWRRQERAVITHADAVVFTNEPARELVMRKYPQEWHHKTQVVPHGYDPRLISPSAPSPERKQRLRMVYTGSLYKERSVQSLLDAIAGLSHEMELKDTLELVIIGPTENLYPKKVKEMGLENIVSFPGRMAYMESLRALARADVLVVIEAPNAEPNPFLPSKLVDYLMFNKPILALSPAAGATADLLRQLACPVVPPDDTAMIRQTLTDIFARWREGRLIPSKKHAEIASHYDVHKTTLVFNDLLKKVICKPASGHDFPRNIWRMLPDIKRRAHSSLSSASIRPGGRPRLCFVSLYSYPLFNPACESPFGGSEVRVAQIARDLARRGKFDVRLVVFDHGQPEVEQSDGIALYAWKGKSCTQRINPSGYVPQDDKSLILKGVNFIRKFTSAGIWTVLNGVVKACLMILRQMMRLILGFIRLLTHIKQRLMAFGRIGPSIVSRAGARMYDVVDADIYVLPGNNEMAAELAMFCKKRGKKYVMLAGSDINFNPGIKTRPRQCDSYGVPGYLMLYAIQNAHAFIVQSERQADLLHCHFGKRAIVVHNPIDITPVFPESETPQDVLWVGKSDKIKRPELALDLAAAFPGNSFTLVMSLSDQAMYERCFQRAGALGNVRILHYVPFNEIERYFAQTRLLLNTSVFEGFPNAFLQAAKYGVPIVSLQVDPGGMLSSHDCGFSCGGSMEKMQDAVRRLLTDKQLHAEKSAHCLRYVREFHDKDKIAAQYEDAFLKILAG